MKQRYDSIGRKIPKPKKLKGRAVRFCSLVARGDLTLTDAYKQAGYAKGGAGTGATRLMRRPQILDEIERLRKKYAMSTTTDAEWIRSQLKKIVNESGDIAGMNKAIDTLNRMNGGYEKDNQQQQGEVTLKMSF